MQYHTLIFDDGPNPFWTLAILDILDEFGYKAVFSMIGKWAEKYPEIVKEVNRRGHIIANHSYSHTKGVDDFDKCEEVIDSIIGIKVKRREPFVIANDELNATDYCEYSSEVIFNRVMRYADEYATIVFHDGSDKEEEMEQRPKAMIEALPRILKCLS